MYFTRFPFLLLCFEFSFIKSLDYISVYIFFSLLYLFIICKLCKSYLYRKLILILFHILRQLTDLPNFEIGILIWWIFFLNSLGRQKIFPKTAEWGQLRYGKILFSNFLSLFSPPFSLFSFLVTLILVVLVLEILAEG